MTFNLRISQSTVDMDPKLQQNATTGDGSPRHKDSAAQKLVKPSIVERIGRRKTDKEGKIAWISQPEWEVEQRKVEAEDNRGSFSICLDDSGEKKRIIITSSALVQVVRRIIPISLFESVPDGVSIEEPYAPLFHFLLDMRSDMIGHAAKPEEVDDIEALEYFLYECQPQYKSLRDALTTGHQALVSFETIWALFKTGDEIVIIDKFEEKRLFKFTHIEEDIGNIGLQRHLCIALSICGWCIVWDREQKSFAQRSCAFKIERFSGHREVKSLPVYPLRCEDENTRKATVLQLQKRGRDWVNLISNTPSCFEYYGRTLEVKEHTRGNSEAFTQLEGRIILDQMNQSPLEEMFDMEVKHRRGIIDEKLHDPWILSASKTLSNPAHFLLCPPTIGCFHGNSGKRYNVSITKLKPVSWSESAMDHLILDDTKKTLLKCLINHNNDERLKTGDIIQNKGRGLTIVLYGPSGVGKTLTAECLAEYARKPLIPLSVGNLVAEEDSIEERLIEAFTDASRLDAILLLDEADVVLEARSFEDVRRNGIVSVFLRQLEYYSGILFLTTNRINSMDPAFQSRIQVAIPYEDLVPLQRERIWKSLLSSALVDLTENDRAIIEKELPALSKHPLNGRQIRNTLKLAAFLALDDVVSDNRVQLKHIKKALGEALQFQQFFEEGRRNFKNKNRVWKPFAPSQDADYS